MLTYLAIGVGIVVLLAIVNRRAVSTMFFNLRSTLGAGARSLDSKNAVSNMKQAVEDAKGEIRGYTTKLNKSQGILNSLTRDQKESASEEARLTSRVHERAAQCGGDSNDPVLLDLAAKLGKAKTRSAELTAELKKQTDLHNNVLKQVQDAVVQADELQKEADRLGVKLDLSATQAELASVGIDFKSSSAHSSLANASKYAKDIQAKIDENNAAVTVAAQLNPNAGSEATREWERNQDAKAVLAGLGIGDKS